MASTTGSPIAARDNGLQALQHHRPASPRELRAQAVHRLQIGLLGLASMLLLVGLANIIMERARASDETPPGAATQAAPAEKASSAAGDPLADIGVVPDLPANETARRAAPAPAGNARPR